MFHEGNTFSPSLPDPVPHISYSLLSAAAVVMTLACFRCVNWLIFLTLPIWHLCPESHFLPLSGSFSVLVPLSVTPIHQNSFSHSKSIQSVKIGL